MPELPKTCTGVVYERTGIAGRYCTENVLIEYKYRYKGEDRAALKAFIQNLTESLESLAWADGRADCGRPLSFNEWTADSK